MRKRVRLTAGLGTGPAWVGDTKGGSDKIETEFILEGLEVEVPGLYLLPTRGHDPVVFLDEVPRKCVELGIAASLPSWTLPVEVADVEERNDEEVEGCEGARLYRKGTIAVRLIATLDLNAHGLDGAARVRVDADQVVAFVIRWRLVSENISSHQVADDEKLSTERDDRKAESIFVAHKPPRGDGNGLRGG